MKKYFYRAVDINKKEYSGYFSAKNKEDLKVRLCAAGLFLTRAKSVSERSPQAFFSVTGRVSVNELTSFCRQFAAMTASGVSVVDGLGALSRQPYSKFFRRVIERVLEDVKIGNSLSAAMAKHKRAFPDFFTGMISVGEESGRLDEILRSLADYYETEAKIARRTKSAMAYPAFLVALALAVAVLTVVFVIPAFDEALSALGAELPALTLAFVNASRWFANNWAYVVIAAVALAAVLVIVGKTKRGRYFYDTLKIKIPPLAKANTALITARFARGFGLLLSGGVDLIGSMRAIVPVLGNKNVERRFMLAVGNVEEGKSLTAALGDYKLFPVELLKMTAVGERTGGLDKALLGSAPYFDERAERVLAAIVNMLQPIMLVIMGAVVGLLFYSVYSPLLSLINTL